MYTLYRQCMEFPDIRGDILASCLQGLRIVSPHFSTPPAYFSEQILRFSHWKEYAECVTRVLEQTLDTY